MSDPYSLVVSLTEHRMKDSIDAWAKWGGYRFSLEGKELSLPLKAGEDEEVHGLIYPKEKEPERSVLLEISAAVRRQLPEFELTEIQRGEIIKWLDTLERQV